MRGVEESAAPVADSSGTFDAFAQRERSALLAFAWSLTGSLSAAEELAQEALAAAWAAWDRVGGFDKPGAWAENCGNPWPGLAFRLSYEHMLGSVESRGEGAEAAVAGPLAAALDGLVDLDPDTLDDAELADAVVELRRQQARLAAATTRLMAAFEARRVYADDGSRSCGAWVAQRCRLPVGQARAEVWLGRRLRTMPATTEAFAAGDISQRHASVLASLAGGRTAEFFARDEGELVDDARRLSWADFCRAVEYWRQCADPDGTERDAARDEALRRVHLSQGLRGTGHLDGLLTALGRATVASALGRIEQELFEADWEWARAEHGDAATACHLARTAAQRRHDALVEMARRAVTAPADGRRPRPLVSVFVGYETFKGRICQLADGTVITPGAVASLLDEALIERVVFDGPSRVIDLGRARRFTGAVRRALEIRDRGCTHEGCDIPSERCQGDHVQPWSQGGLTTTDNGQLRCGHHNRWRWDHPDHDPPPATPQRPSPYADVEQRKAWLEAWRTQLRASMLAEPAVDAPDG
jgi:hypothetical protein